MSGKAKADYDVAFRTVLEQQLPTVESTTTDFQVAIPGKPLGQILPDVQLRNCVFHFMEAVWRKTQEPGL